MGAEVRELKGEMVSGEWVGWGNFWPDDINERNKGRLIVLVGLKLEEGGEEETGQEVLRRANEVYYGGSGGQAGLEEVWTELGDEFPGIYGVIVVSRGEEMGLKCVGQVGVWAQLGEKGGWLYDWRTGKGGKTATGKWQKGLKLVVGNARFWEEVQPDEVERGVEVGTGGLGLVVSNLLPAVHRQVQKENEEEEQRRPEENVAEAREEGEEKVGVREEEQELKMNLGTERLMEKWARPKVKLPTRIQLKAKWRSLKGKLMEEEEQPRRDWRRNGMIGAAVLTILAVIFLGGRAKRADEIKANSVEEKTIVALMGDFANAKTALGVSRDQAKQMLEGIEVRLGQLNEEQKQDERIVTLQNELGGVLGAATGKRPVVFEEVANVGLQRQGVKLTDLQRDEKGKLWMLDKNESRLIVVNPESGAVEVVRAKNELGNAEVMATYPGRVVVKSEKGIVVCLTEAKECRVEVPPASEWKGIAGMVMWAGNIYLLDPGAGQIWKYPATEAGYGEIGDWVGVDSPANTSGAVAMAIDGNIWVVGNFEEGKVRKFVGGNAENIKISQLEGQLGSDVGIYTDDEAERLYILDRQNGRVVVVTKTGEYIEQWVNEGFKTVSSLVVDEKAGQAWLAQGDKIWGVRI